MKSKALIFLSLALLLTSCSFTSESPAKTKVSLGCKSFVNGYKDYNYRTPLLAGRYFSEAAQIDPGYISLAQSAQILKYSSSEAVAQSLATEWQMANRLVWGVCSSFM